MTQRVVLNNLIKYLAEGNPDGKLNRLGKAYPGTHKLRELLKSGHCFGFAVCFGAMTTLDKTNWWEAALFEVATWDGDPDKLDKIVELPGTEDDKHSTLRNIFERVLNYVVFNQVDPFKKLTVDYEMSQFDFLNPTEEHFLILTDGDVKKKIIHRDAIAGNFSLEDLDLLLNEEHVAGSICIITHATHAISISYQNGNWILYDPNHSHNTSKHIYLTFTSKTELINEINRILGGTLGIDVARYNELKDKTASPFDSFIKNLTPEKCLLLLEKFGFHLLAGWNADALSTIIDKADADPRFAESLAESLAAKDSWPGLGMVVLYSRKVLPKILKIISRLQNAPHFLGQALQATTTDEWTGLVIVARYAPEYLAEILDIASRSSQFHDLLVQILSVQDNEGWMGLHMAARYAPEVLPKILNIASRCQEFPAFLVLALLTKTSNWIGLHIFAEFAPPKSLLEMLESASRCQQFPQQLAKLLEVRDDYGWTVLHLIAKYAPEILSRVLQIASQARQFPTFLSSALCTKSKDGVVGLNLVEENAKKDLAVVIQYIAKSKLMKDRALINKLISLSKTIKNYDYTIIKIFLLNLHTKVSQQEFICGFKNGNTIPSIKILDYLPNNCDAKKEMAVEIVTHILYHALNPEKVLQLIQIIETNRLTYHFLFERRGTLTTWSMRGHCWRGSEVSHSWIKIINTAKQRIIDLEQIYLQPLSEDAVNFLRMQTQERSFFIAEDYYRKHIDFQSKQLPSYENARKSNT